jgi:hypothetical protein
MTARIWILVCSFAVLGLAQAEPRIELVQPETIPYAPYRVNNDTLDDYHKRRILRTVFSTGKTPVDRSALEPSGDIGLTLTFNQQMDLSSLPPNVQGWRIHTPTGVLDESNFREHGAFEWNSLPTVRGDVAVPPNTLEFRFLKNDTPTDQLLKYTLELAEAPRSVWGFEAEDFEPGQPYELWSFRIDETPIVSTTQGLLEVTAAAPDGTNADLSPPSTALTIRGDLSGDGFQFEYYESRPPHTLPHHERVWQLYVPKPDKQEPSTEWPLAFRYQQKVFDALRPFGVTQDQPVMARWEAQSATVDEFQVEDSVVEVRLTLQAEPVGENAEGTLNITLRLKLDLEATRPRHF